MQNRIEQEINKTLQYMDNGIDIQISSDFTENINNRISKIKISRSAGYRINIYYSLMIILLVILNLATLLINLKGQSQIDNTINNQTSVLANEYGISLVNFNI